MCQPVATAEVHTEIPCDEDQLAEIRSHQESACVPVMKVRGAKPTVTTAKIIMKLFVLAPTVLKISVDMLLAEASICSKACIMVIQ